MSAAETLEFVLWEFEVDQYYTLVSAVGCFTVDKAVVIEILTVVVREEAHELPSVV